MRVAVCLSGQLRDYKGCYESLFDNIILPTNADLYVYAWDWNYHRLNFGVEPTTTRYVINGTKDEFLQMYKPHKYKFTSCEDFLSDNDFSSLYEKRLGQKKAQINRMMCMLYSISRCFNMLNFSEYDIIFRCRTEINYKEKIKEKYLNQAMKGNLIIPHGSDSGGCQDVFAFGPPDQMWIYSSLYHYVKKYSEIDSIKRAWPETMLKHHLTVNNARIKRVKFPMTLRGVNYD
jgi:hypothetical protein